ncbi:MAG: hypothetical protein GXP08_16935, partial [Gammaproteobacteria bacterium]|nr:hypothetical protein [Gammaproteobacteria bacterium]
RLNPDLVQDGEVSGTFLQWSADSQRVMYYADQDVDGEIEFYSSTRDGNSNNIKISTSELVSFAAQIYPQLSSGCSSCHFPGATAPNWFEANASDTYTAMNSSAYFDNNLIVEKLDGTRSHTGGTNSTLASMFTTWISEGANNN